MNDLRVRDLMTPNVVTVRHDDTIATAYELMLENRFRHLVVLNEDGDLVGLLTHRDLLRHALIERAELPLGLQRSILKRIRVEEVMTSEVETAEPGQWLHEAARMMFENKYGCLPVVDNARLVGILTEADFVRFFALTTVQQPALRLAGMPS
ncbi:MAG TPA: CBS domain-containing protein [Thermoanaerobaculia bacterium]|nr:CBS domain-containing protein [Thermoanaerobaculia bacterium]